MNPTQIAQRQSELVDLINSLETNFRKDGAGRKTPEYLMKKLTSLESFWQEFKSNHGKLVQFNSPPEYFSQNICSKLEERYILFKNTLLSYKYNTLESESTSGETNNDGKANELLNQMGTYIKAFERQVNLLDLEDISEKWQLEDELKQLTLRWENIDNTYWNLCNIITNMEPYDQDFNRLEKIFKQSKLSINRRISNTVHQEQSAPKIEIPLFYGSYEQWLSFKDLFVETIHLNPHISNSQKMQHLKSKLRGEAERLVQHLQISADNYTTCWDILKQRYDNMRLLFAHHATTLLNQPNIQHPTAAQLKKMHDVTWESINAIKNLGINTDTWDPLIVYIVSQKLDSETRESYIESMKAPRMLPNLKEFLNYLENKFMAQESANRTT